VNTFRELIEARSNPELNTRQSSFAELSRYAGDKDIFVSFTSSFSEHNGKEVRNPDKQHKIGINPNNSYGTPIGIYCYPIDYIIQYSKDKGKITGPYTGKTEWRFLYILRRSTEGYIDSKTDLKPYEDKLHALMEQMLGEEKASKMIGEAIATANQATPRSRFWNTTRVFANAYAALETTPSKKATTAWNVIMRMIGVNQYVDDLGEGVVHTSEPTQAVFFTTQAFKVAGMLQRDRANREEDSHTYRQGLAKGINSKKINLTAVNPLVFGKVLPHLDVDGMKWLASQLGAIEKRAINEQFGTHWPYGLMFNKDTLEGARAFGPIKDTVAVTAALNNGTYSWKNIEEVFPRATRNVWKLVWDSAIVAHSWDSNRLVEDIKEAPVMSKNAVMGFLDALANPRVNWDSFDCAVDMINKANIVMEGEVAKAMFAAFPRRMVKDDRVNLGFADWYRFMRTGNNFDTYGDLIPIKFGKILLARNGTEKRTFEPSVEWMKRLIIDDPKYALGYYLNRYDGVYPRFEEAQKLLAPHMDAMLRKKPDWAMLMMRQGGLSDAQQQVLIRAAWRNCNSRTPAPWSKSTIIAGTRSGLITEEEFTKNVSPNTADVAFNSNAWPAYSLPSSALRIKCIALAPGLAYHIRSDMVESICDHHPALIDKIDCYVEPDVAFKVVDKHWEKLKNNMTFVRNILADDAWTLMKKHLLGTTNMENEYFYYFSDNQEAIVAACLRDDPKNALLINDNLMGGMFKPLPTYYNYNSLPANSWSALFGTVEVDSDLAKTLLYSYRSDIYGKLKVSERYMREFATLSSANAARMVAEKIFFNDVPDDLRLELQMAAVKRTIEYYGHSEEEQLDRILHDQIEHMYMPHPEVIDLYRDHVERHKAKVAAAEAEAHAAAEAEAWLNQAAPQAQASSSNDAATTPASS
jgi:hypothetical protein